MRIKTEGGEEKRRRNIKINGMQVNQEDRNEETTEGEEKRRRNIKINGMQVNQEDRNEDKNRAYFNQDLQLRKTW